VPIEEFTPDKWIFNEMPGKDDELFTRFQVQGIHCHQTLLSLMLLLFLLVYCCNFWACCARAQLHTNAKAEIEQAKSDKKGSPWTPTCAAELKAWLATILYWYLFLPCSFKHFCNHKMDSQRIRQYFPDI